MSLNITGTLGDRHALDSIVASVDIYDTVEISFAFGGKTDIRFAQKTSAAAFAPFAARCVEKDNTVAAAMRLLKTRYPSLGAEITVYKGIPVAGGLGGSSADAAAVLYAARMALPSCGTDFERESIAIGSDVPVLLRGGGVRLRGEGELLQSVPLPVLHLTVAHGGQGVSSGAAYKKFDELYPQKRYCPSDTEALLRAANAGGDIAPYLQNALQPAATALCPQIEQTLLALRQTAATAVFMSGSGNACCGVYADSDSAERAAAQMRARGFAAVSTETKSEGMTFV